MADEDLDEMSAEYVKLARAARIEQGLPEVPRDPVVLARVSAMMAEARELHQSELPAGLPRALDDEADW